MGLGFMNEGFASRVLDAALMLCAQEGHSTAEAIAHYIDGPPQEIAAQLIAWARSGQLIARPGGAFVRATIGAAWQSIRVAGGSYPTDFGLRRRA